MAGYLSIQNVTKAYGSLRAVDDVTLQIQQGEVFSLLGPSGGGKTTLLRLLAGFVMPDSGSIWLDDKDISQLPPEQRPVNTVFQNYALFPHLNVWDNIAFGLRISGRSRSDIKAAVERMLALVRLGEHARKRPAQLSGGQKQRVAIARALINEPKVLLLDEPLAALDLKLRQHMLTELNTLHREVGTTFVYVTHDQGEAVSLSDRIAVINDGRVQQVATPVELYETPANAFVAGFIGDANFLTGTVQERLTSDFIRVHIEGVGNPVIQAADKVNPGEVVRFMVRPEKLVLSQESPGHGERWNRFRARVEEVNYFGPHLRLRVRCGEHVMNVQHQLQQVQSRQGAWATGQELWLSFEPESGRMIAD